MGWEVISTISSLFYYYVHSFVHGALQQMEMEVFYYVISAINLQTNAIVHEIKVKKTSIFEKTADTI